MASADLTAARLRQLLHYDQLTGVFTWLQRTSNRIKVGDVAGSIDSNRYRVIVIDGKHHGAHRLAWLYVNGVWPNGEIDHEDGCRDNNRWKNLRDGTKMFNLENQRGPHRDTTSGYLGVSWNTQRDKWKATIWDRSRGRQKHLGFFDDPKVAHEAYVAAKRLMHEGNTL